MLQTRNLSRVKTCDFVTDDVISGDPKDVPGFLRKLPERYFLSGRYRDTCYLGIDIKSTTILRWAKSDGRALVSQHMLNIFVG